jgi:hypothetical protein
MTLLAEIYNLSLTNLHIFFDTKGGLIAFNKSGSIFLNLRYYEAWREWIAQHFFTAIESFIR